MQSESERAEAWRYEINVQRLLVLMECDGHFHQVYLDAKQFKTVSDAIICPKHTPKQIEGRPDLPEGAQMVKVHLSDWQVDADTFLGLNDICEITPDDCNNDDEEDDK